MKEGDSWECSLPLLPAGTTLFDSLPFGAVVVDALAPAVGSGVITVMNGSDQGVLVIRGGSITETVWVADGVRATGEHALALIHAQAATVSARQLSDDAMVLVGPLIRAEPRYADLRLEWVVWPRLLNDLRERDQTFVVEVTTPNGRGITIIQGGRQIATFGESGAALGDADLLNDLAAGAVGTIRVLIDRGVAADPQADASSCSAASETPYSSGLVGPEPSFASPKEEAHTRHIVALDPAGPIRHGADDPNATLSAMFGPHPDSVEWHPVALEHPAQHATTSVESVLPQLLSLVQARLQRSSGSVEQVVDDAASDHQSVGWLADRVRVMTVRGFLRTTFEQLADDILAVAAREAD